MQPRPRLIGMNLPLLADYVAPPRVEYGEAGTYVNLLAAQEPVSADDLWCRVSFECLDAIRVSRGEFLPFEFDDHDAEMPANARSEARVWGFKVHESPWLRERHAYESQAYRESYVGLGRNVDEMLSEFSHYLFQFHDEFVEAIAAGIWLESSWENLGCAPLSPDHPFRDLPIDACSEYIEAHGIKCQVRRNPQPIDRLAAAAELCSQKLMQFVPERDGSSFPILTVALRQSPTGLRSHLIGHEEVIDGVASLADVEFAVIRRLEWMSQHS